MAEGGAVALFVGWSMTGGNSGALFEPELLGRLGALGVGLSLDIDSRADT
ncbi:hypothetical protein ACQKJ1_00940 [Methylorubrum rhodesianum]